MATVCKSKTRSRTNESAMPATLDEMFERCEQSTTVLRIGDDHSIPDSECPVGFVEANTVEGAVAILESRIHVLRKQFGHNFLAVIGRRLDFEDGLQAARLKIVEHIESCLARTEDALAAWVYAVSHNAFKSVLRRETEQIRDVRMEWHFSASDVAPDVYAFAIDERVRSDLADVEELEEVLLRLPVREARVVRMRYLGGYSHDDIAGVLGVTNTASRQLCKRGLAKLRELMPRPV